MAELTVDRCELCVEGAPLRISTVVLPSEVLGRVASASVDGERLDIEGRERALTFGRIATARERITFHLAP